MSTSMKNRRRPTRAIHALSVAAMLTLASCGGGGTDPTASESESDRKKTSTTVATTSGDPTPDDGEVESAEAVAILPVGGEAPAGFRLGIASCDIDKTTEEDRNTYASWVVYGVPEAWETQGFSGGGSGGYRDTQELNFDTDGGNSSDGRVKIEVEWDDRKPDGTLLDIDGDPWESFDYTVEYPTEPAKNATITYDEMATVEVGDGSADLYFRDPAQNRDQLDESMQYKARVTAFEVPRSSTELDEIVPASFVVTVSYDGGDVELSQGDIEKILGSFTLPECTWTKILGDAELSLGVDLDGDGKARDSEDVQADIEDTLESVRENMTPEQRKEFDEMRKRLNSNSDN